MQVRLPVHRAAFALRETYAYAPELPLDGALSAFGGVQDGYVSRRRLESWHDQTNGPFLLWMLPGDHFFIHTNHALLLTILARELRALLTTLI